MDYESEQGARLAPPAGQMPSANRHHYRKQSGRSRPSGAASRDDTRRRHCDHHRRSDAGCHRRRWRPLFLLAAGCTLLLINLNQQAGCVSLRHRQTSHSAAAELDQAKLTNPAAALSISPASTSQAAEPLLAAAGETIRSQAAPEQDDAAESDSAAAPDDSSADGANSDSTGSLGGGGESPNEPEEAETGDEPVDQATDAPPTTTTSRPPVDLARQQQQQANLNRPSRQSNGAQPMPQNFNRQFSMVNLNEQMRPTTMRQLPVTTTVQPTQTARLATVAPATTRTPPLQPAFDVNMGSTRMMIKPPDEPPFRRPAATTTPSSLIAATSASFGDADPQHEFVTELSALQANSNNNNNNQHSNSLIERTYNLNERRQDLMYPAASVSSGNTVDEQQTSHQRANNANEHANNNNYLPHKQQQNTNEQQQQQQDSLAVASICYTPLGLVMIILITMLVTVAICFCTLYSIKYLKKHQFDLVANSKQFDCKHAYSFGGGAGVRGAPEDQHPASPTPLVGNAGHRNQAFACSSSASIISNSPFGLISDQDANKSRPGGCLAHLFKLEPTCNKCLALGDRLRLESPSTNNQADSCATFRNPYFSADDQAARDQQYHQADSMRPATQADCCEQIDCPASRRPQQQQQIGLLKTAPTRTGRDPNDEHLDFIESHIANLHNRQVTSSVKELSILGQSPSRHHRHESFQDVAPLARVVDLTSAEQRARVLADPREGDLIAIDISGHDIIGLGFDVCGNQRDGIFVKSVASRGPAKESGAIQPGDRVKCLNISFENVTLQDACDLLNCGSPYKMRLLLEKRVLPATMISKLNQADSTSGSSKRRADKTSRPMSFDGTIDATKSYLKKITNKIGSSNKQQLVGGEQLRQQPHGIQDPYALNWHHKSAASLVLANSSTGHPHDDQSMVAQYLGHAPAPLGSMMARQLARMRNSSLAIDDEDDQQATNVGSPSGGGHFNPAYQSRLSDSDDQRESWRAVAYDEHDAAASRRQHRPREESIGSQSQASSAGSSAARRHKLQGPPLTGRNVNSDLSRVHDHDDLHDRRRDGALSTSRQQADREDQRRLEQSRSQPEISAGGLRLDAAEDEAPKSAQQLSHAARGGKPTPPIKPTSQSIGDLQSIINSDSGARHYQDYGNHDQRPTSIATKSSGPKSDVDSALSALEISKSDGQLAATVSADDKARQ